MASGGTLRELDMKTYKSEDWDRIYPPKSVNAQGYIRVSPVWMAGERERFELRRANTSTILKDKETTFPCVLDVNPWER